MKEYKVFIYKEPVFTSLFFNNGKVDPVKMARELNLLAAEGWQVKTMEREQRRALLFFSREAFIFIMEREKNAKTL